MKSTIVFTILFLLIAPLVFADDIDSIKLLSPANGNTIDPIRNGFAYTPLIRDYVKECGLYINSELKKSVLYDDVVNQNMIYFNTDIPDGTYNWSVYCIKQNGVKIVSEVRSFNVLNEEDIVELKSSGVFRGSIAHEFTFENSITQEPVVVKKLAAGDYIWVIFNIEPSNIRKELYVRRFASEQGKQYLILEDQKKNEVYKIFAGDTAKINIAPSSINIKFIGLELNRATVLVSPVLSDEQIAEQGTAIKPEDKPEEKPIDKPEEKPVEKPAETPTTGTTGTTSPENSEGANSPTDESKPGVFKRFFSWLTSIFGA